MVIIRYQIRYIYASDNNFTAGKFELHNKHSKASCATVKAGKVQKVVTFDFKGRHFIYQEFMSAEQSRNCSALLVHHLLISLPLLILRANLQSSPEHCMNCCTENFELKVCFFVSFFNSNRIEL